ncbi:PKD domain-containing protein, partial [Streptomyces sp. NPDC054787]
LVVVPVINGKVSFYNNAGTVDLIADVAGYYTTDGTGSTYKPITPTRLMDTREGLGVPKAKISGGGTATLQVTGTAGIPATGVTAVVLNVTATDPTAGSYVSVYPNGTTRTSASNLNFTAGQTIPNLVVVPVINGKVSFYNNAGTVDLIADVAGYYTTT